jgi:hypothetical protein
MDMRTAAEWLNPVKAVGMGAYFTASTACAVVSVRAASRRISRLAAVLALLHAVLFLDITFDWRWRLYDWLRDQAVALQWYEQRHWPQVGTLLLLAALLGAGMIMARRRFPSPPGAALALDGALLSIGCWAMEVISLHATDTVLYHRTGPLMPVSFVWIVACTMTAAGILRAGTGDRAAVTGT